MENPNSSDHNSSYCQNCNQITGTYVFGDFKDIICMICSNEKAQVILQGEKTPFYLDNVSNNEIALPEDAETIKKVGVNVEQDGHRDLNSQDQIYYYIGKDIAWTTRIRTCSALAIYDPSTGISFLCHADGEEGNEDRILEHLKIYLGKCSSGSFKNLIVNVFTAQDTKENNGGSYKIVIECLNELNLESKAITYVDPDDTVAVFPNGPARRLRPSLTLLVEALKNYSENQTEERKKYICQMLEQPGYRNNEEVYSELKLLFRILNADGKDSSFLKYYLSRDDIKSLQPPEQYSNQEGQKTWPVWTPSNKPWADYSDSD
jgi:hypothetical protein